MTQNEPQMNLNEPKMRQPDAILNWIDQIGMGAAVKYWAERPVEFCMDVLRMKPQAWQADFMQAVSNARFGKIDKKRFAVRSGAGVGKTSGVACLILWHLACFPDSKIPCTAPTSPQLKAVLWPELRKWVGNIPAELREVFPYDVQTDRVTLLENFAVARTVRDGQYEAFQGFHAKSIMIIADEASGVPDEVFLAGQGVMSSKGALTILIGNPTRANGWFYEAFHGDSDKYWTKRIACHDSEYVTQEYIDDMREKHGENSYEFKVRVLGEFHLEDAGLVIPRPLIDAAIGRDVARDTEYIIWGIDVSAGGKDKSALAKRSGNTLLEPTKSWGGKDVMQMVGIIVDEYWQQPQRLRPHEILVDVIGVGHGFVSRLKEQMQGVNVKIRGINVAERKSVSDRYVSLRVELWARAREWFEGLACTMPKDEPLTAQLASVEWEVKDSNGRWALIDKKAGGSSPDNADAFILTFAGNKMPLYKNEAITMRNLILAGDKKIGYATGSASWLQPGSR